MKDNIKIKTLYLEPEMIYFTCNKCLSEAKINDTCNKCLCEAKMNDTLMVVAGTLSSRNTKIRIRDAQADNPNSEASSAMAEMMTGVDDEAIESAAGSEGCVGGGLPGLVATTGVVSGDPFCFSTLIRYCS